MGLCGWIISVVDWLGFWGVVRGSDFWILALVVLMRLFGTVLSAYRWQGLLAVHEMRHPLARLTRWYLSSGFLGQLLPTSIGGDAFRIYKTMGGKGARADAVVAVLGERVAGLSALLAAGFVAALWVFLATSDPMAGSFMSVVGIGLSIGVAGLWLGGRFDLLDRLSRRPRQSRVGKSLTAPLTDLREHPGALVRALVISLLFHLNRVAAIWLILLALGTTTDYVELIVASAMVEVAGLLPISLGGFGVVEGSFILVMGRFGLDRETALAGMLLMRVLLLPSHLLGAIFYFMGDRGGEARAASEPSVAEDSPSRPS